MTSFEQAVTESTCRKRIVVCELYDAEGTLLARASNRCNPPGGICARMERQDGQATYPTHSECGWTHAEVMAVAALTAGISPTRAILYGHDFPCPACEDALRKAGVIDIEVRQSPATGPR